MMLPQNLQTLIEEKAAAIPLQTLRQDASALSVRYRTGSGQGQRLLTRDAEAQAYALVRMPATFGAVRQALKWTLDCTDIRLETMIDAGAGTGAASWAADTLLSLRQVTCLEREQAMTSLGRELMQCGADVLRAAAWLPFDLTRDETDCRADLVISAYVTNEMTQAGRVEAVRRLWQMTGQLLLIVEPGTPRGWQQLMEIRQLLLQEGAMLAAPCPQVCACPLQQDDWCQFNARIPRSRLHRLLKEGDAPYEDEKFCYLAFTRSQPTPVEARILRHPAVAKGEIGLKLCTPSGISARSVRKREGDIFRLARKADAGDPFIIA